MVVSKFDNLSTSGYVHSLELKLTPCKKEIACMRYYNGGAYVQEYAIISFVRIFMFHFRLEAQIHHSSKSHR